MTNRLTIFMRKHFHQLELKAPLFYSWKYGLRFEISNPLLEHEDKANLEQMAVRTKTIFQKVFEESDDLLLVTDIHCCKKDTFLQKKPVKVYQKYIKDKQLLLKLQHQEKKSVHYEEDDELVTHRFILPCRKDDIRFTQLLHAITYEDFSHPAKILKGFPQYGFDIYFVNITKRMIYHLYDDRGCDVIATNKEALFPLYKECNAWLLNYDREKMDKLLNRLY